MQELSCVRASSNEDNVYMLFLFFTQSLETTTGIVPAYPPPSDTKGVWTLEGCHVFIVVFLVNVITVDWKISHIKIWCLRSCLEGLKFSYVLGLVQAKKWLNEISLNHEHPFNCLQAIVRSKNLNVLGHMNWIQPILSLSRPFCFTR